MNVRHTSRQTKNTTVTLVAIAHVTLTGRWGTVVTRQFDWMVGGLSRHEMPVGKVTEQRRVTFYRQWNVTPQHRSGAYHANVIRSKDVGHQFE